MTFVLESGTPHPALRATLSLREKEVMEALTSIERRIHNAAVRAKRDPQSITLIAVTKTVPVDRIREAAKFGVRDVGENRLQEATLNRRD